MASRSPVTSGVRGEADGRGGDLPERAPLTLIDPLSHPYVTMFRRWPEFLQGSVESPRGAILRTVAKLMGVGGARPGTLRFVSPLGEKRAANADAMRFYLQAAGGLRVMLGAPSLEDLRTLVDLYDPTAYAESNARFKEMLLYSIVRKYRPESLVETGVAHGVSSSYILSALAANGKGHLESVDLPTYDPKGFVDSSGKVDTIHIPKGRSPGWRIPDRLRDRWTLHVGDSRSFLTVRGDGKVDLFFHDSDHGYPNMKWEFDWGWSHLVPGGWMVSDDVLRNSAWDEFLKAHPEGRVLCSTRIGAVQKPEP